MVVRSKNKVKAAILLIVFSLNTMVGFACALGLDLSASNDEHKHEATTGASGAHSHDGHQHSTGDANSAASTHSHDADQHSSSHSHNNAAHPHSAEKDHHEQNEAATHGCKSDCCTEEVVPLQQVDKAVAKNITVPLLNFTISFSYSFFGVDVLSSFYQRCSYPNYVRWRPSSTIPDIRIAIQSFQI
jgi:hypothetical protein